MRYEQDSLVTMDNGHATLHDDNPRFQYLSFLVSKGRSGRTSTRWMHDAAHSLQSCRSLDAQEERCKRHDNKPCFLYSLPLVSKGNGERPISCITQDSLDGRGRHSFSSSCKSSDSPKEQCKCQDESPCFHFVAFVL